jgi:hypothetical protein
MSDVPSTTIEIFPTELYLKLFRYFDAVALHQTFGGINYKIDCIVKQAPLYFNFQRKITLDDGYVVQRILPFVDPQNIRSLKFYVQTGISTQLLADHLLSSFARLCSLTLYIYSGMPCLIDHIPLLANLNKLEVYFLCNASDFGPERLVNSIFNENQVNNSRLSLNTLTIYFNEQSMTLQVPFSAATTNIQHLKIHPFNYAEFISILPCLPSIRSVDISFWNIGMTGINLSSVPLVQLANCEKLMLQLSTSSELEELECLLKHTPNLKVLGRTTKIDLVHFNAAQWKFIAMKYCKELQRIELHCIYWRYDFDDDWSTTLAPPHQIIDVFFPEFLGKANYDDDGDCVKVELTRSAVG